MLRMGSKFEALPDGETYQYGDYVMSNTNVANSLHPFIAPAK
jgi:hypothetical protein